MAIDRAAAKAAGYTDAEIDAYEAQKQPLGAFQQQPERDQLSKVTGGLLTTGAGNPYLEAILQGATFGFSDELQGLIGGSKEEIRQQQQQMMETSPATALGLNLAGGLASGSALPSLLKTFGGGRAAIEAAKARPLLASMAGGAGGGALAGAGFAESMEQVPSQMIQGAALGAAIPPVLKGLKTLATPITNLVTKGVASATSGASPRSIAETTIARQLGRGGIGADDISALQERLGPQGRLVDMPSANIKQLAEDIVSVPGKAAEIAQRELSSRMLGSTSRLIGDAKKVLGEGNYLQTTKGIIKSMKTAAKPYYDDLVKQSVKLDSELSDLIERPDMKSALNKGFRKAANEGIKIGKTEGEIPFVALDYAKRSIDDKIGAAIRSGNMDDARIFQGMKRELLGYMDNAFGGYSDARKIYTDGSSMTSAAELGKKILRSDSDEMMEFVADMSDAEKKMFSIGAMKSISDKIKSTVEGADASRRFATSLVKERIRPAFADDDTYKSFIKGLEREKIFMESKGVMGGSPTAKRLGARQQFGEEAALDAATGNWLNTALNTVRDFVSGEARIPENVRDEIGEILFKESLTGKPVAAGVVRKLAKYNINKQRLDSLLEMARSGTVASSGVAAGREPLFKPTKGDSNGQ